MESFTEEVIMGKKYRTMLPKGYSLVLEGGGMRGFFSAGVLDAFMEEGIMFPYIISVSAGSANVLSYISGQLGRNRILVDRYVSNKRYSGIKNWVFKKSFFDFDYIFSEIAAKHLFFDKKVFEQTNVRLLTGATDCESGKIKWFEKNELGDDFLPSIASCSIPLFSQIVAIDNREYLDGGLASPISIDKSIEDENDFHVVVLTRNKGYIKKPFKYKKIINGKYKQYPNLVEAVMNRHDIYNKELALCEELEQNGKAIIIRPKKKLELDKFNKNKNKLLALYDEGILEGKKAIEMLKKMGRI